MVTIETTYNANAWHEMFWSKLTYKCL